MSRISIAVLAVIALAGAAVLGTVLYERHSVEEQLAQEQHATAEAGRSMVAAMAKTRSESAVARGMIFENVLKSVGVEPQAIPAMTEAARPLFNFRNLKQGNKVVVMRSLQGEVRAITYRVDPEHELWIARADEGFRAHMRNIPSQMRTATVIGQINGSLFEGVLDAGERPELAVRLAEIFAWDLDFYTDPQPGDTFRLVVEKKEYGGGEPPSYGRILVAEYANAGHPYQAVLFHDTDGHPGYYSGEGKSLQKAFLRSPLKFAARVSSHFSRARFHPILKIYRPHLGTDYAAPTGTPVQAIANGRVVSAGWGGGGGNTIRLAHANNYESYYMHLSRILVRAGQHVQQGQRIGLVGMTGLATGPHLDFRLRQRGAFVNFERLKLPPAFPVPASEMAAFTAERDKWFSLLPSVESIKTAVAVAQAKTNGGASGGH